MAMMLVRRLHQRRLPFPARYMGSSSIQATAGSRSRNASCKVEDRTLRLTAIDEDGDRHPILGLTGHTVLKTLVNCGLVQPERHPLEDITACSGQCQVSVAKEWLEKLPPRTDAETYVLKSAASGNNIDQHSRLGCQIVLTPDLDGMVFAVAEEKPWRTL